MRKIIFASHSNLAGGLKDTIQYIIPSIKDITAISAYTSNVPVEDEIDMALESLKENDEAIIFTDLLGGSVNQAFIKYLNNPNIHIITGMNVPVVMTLLLSLTDNKITKEQIDTAINEGQQQIIYVNEYFTNQEIDMEDE